MTNTLQRSSMVFLLLAGLILPTLAQAWWSDDWQLRKVIKVDTTSTGGNLNQELADVPVLVRLHVGNFSYFFDVKADTSDLRFIAADDKTPLKFYVERFDQVNQMALIWVTLPKLLANSKADFFYMYFNNPAAVSAADAAGVFDASQVLVYHFNKDKLKDDATAYKNNAEPVNVESISGALIGDGARFNGQARLRIPASESTKFTAADGMHLSAWVRYETEQNDAWLFTQRSDAAELQIAINKNQLTARYQSGQSIVSTPATPITPATWHHIGVNIKANKLSMFVDGAEVATLDVTFQGNSGDIYLGSAADGTHGFTGDMDEVRVANKGIVAAQFFIEARNQGIDSTLLTYAEDENRSSASGGASFFPIIMKNVTTDGWVVIGILMVMAIISWIIMIGKSLFLFRVKKDNQAFLKEFNRLGASDPAKLDHEEDEQERELQHSPVTMALFGHHDHYQSSNIYHVYHRGIQEIKLRLGKAVGANVVLTPEAQNAIRASLDAQVVRESQKLNAQMVLLTIAISGGPFMGLLGTVVGVMITFAAIAASGDVNINAIAPGIAAALLATVAGLVVAIPALFGYNYLGSKVKEATADMQVFVDEFITKIGEHYSH